MTNCWRTKKNYKIKTNEENLCGRPTTGFMSCPDLDHGLCVLLEMLIIAVTQLVCMLVRVSRVFLDQERKTDVVLQLYNQKPRRLQCERKRAHQNSHVTKDQLQELVTVTSLFFALTGIDEADVFDIHLCINKVQIHIQPFLNTSGIFSMQQY